MGELTAFVTDGDQRPALAITRSLARRGVSILVGAEQKSSLASASRYCTRHVTYPSPYDRPSEFSRFLQDFVKRERIDVVVPVTDVTTLLVARDRDGFGPRAAVAAPSFAAFDCAANKNLLLRRAAACGIAIPHTHFIENASELEAVLPHVSYPAVVKPHRSRILTAAGWLQTTVQYATSEAELRRLYRETEHLTHYPSMIQERIEGPGSGVFVLCDHGRLLTAFAHRRLREKPPSGGASVLSEAVALDPVLVDQTMRLLGPLEWHGVAMVEFKQDRKTGRSVLMEVNGRFWGSLQLAIDAGVDFPYLACQLALGRAPTVPSGYRVGTRSRWLLGDFDHLLVRLFHSRESQHLTDAAPSRARACIEFLKLLGPDLHYDVMSSTDPGPTFFEVRHYAWDLSQSVARVGRRLRARIGSRAAVRPALVLPHLNDGERGGNPDAID